MKRLAILAVLTAAACGGGGSGGDTPVPDAPARDAAGAGFGTCVGTCRTTALTAMFSATRMLDRAVYGFTRSPPSLHIEAYRGGSPGCPTETSPATDYTLILGRVPVPTSTTASTSPANILDFKGDLLGGPLGAQATMVTIAPVAADVCPTCFGMPAPSDLDGFVALDVMLTFPNGTVTGHIFATHCDSLDAAN